LEIWHQATQSPAAATVFLVAVILCGCFAVVGAQQTASRLTHSFARDDALVGSHWLKQIHPQWKVPVWALLVNSVVVSLIGCVYLGSTNAFNSMISTGVVLQQLSFAIPASLLLYRRRSSKFLPAGRSFNLRHFGWIANSLTIVLSVISLVFYSFPTVMPVTASNMSMSSSVSAPENVLTALRLHMRRDWSHGNSRNDQLVCSCSKTLHWSSGRIVTSCRSKAPAVQTGFFQSRSRMATV
jgi:choline transport protein